METVLETGAPEAAETLRVVYPQIFAEVQTRLLTRAAELEAKLPYQKVLQASLLFDVPLDASLRPEFVARLQEAHSSNSAQAGTSQAAAGAAPGQPPVPSVAKQPNLSQLYAPDAPRRSQRF